MVWNFRFAHRSPHNIKCGQLSYTWILRTQSFYIIIKEKTHNDNIELLSVHTKSLQSGRQLMVKSISDSIVVLSSLEKDVICLKWHTPALITVQFQMHRLHCTTSYIAVICVNVHFRFFALWTSQFSIMCTSFVKLSATGSKLQNRKWVFNNQVRGPEKSRLQNFFVQSS